MMKHNNHSADVLPVQVWHDSFADVTTRLLQNPDDFSWGSGVPSRVDDDGAAELGLSMSCGFQHLLLTLCDGPAGANLSNHATADICPVGAVEHLTDDNVRELTGRMWRVSYWQYSLKWHMSETICVSRWATPSPRSSSWCPLCGCSPRSIQLLRWCGPQCPWKAAWEWEGPAGCPWWCSPQWRPHRLSCRPEVPLAQRSSPAAAAGSRGSCKGAASTSACAASGTGSPPRLHRPQEAGGSSTQSSWSGARGSRFYRAAQDPLDPGPSGLCQLSLTWFPERRHDRFIISWDKIFFVWDQDWLQVRFSPWYSFCPTD